MRDHCVSPLKPFARFLKPSIKVLRRGLSGIEKDNEALYVRAQNIA